MVAAPEKMKRTGRQRLLRVQGIAAAAGCKGMAAAARTFHASLLISRIRTA
jgi:hypothetical protein